VNKCSHSKQINVGTHSPPQFLADKHAKDREIKRMNKFKQRGIKQDIAYKNSQNMFSLEN